MPDLAAAIATIRRTADAAETGDPDASQIAIAMAEVADAGERHYTVAEVADRYRVCRDTVRDAITSGRLRAVRVGRSVRISASAVAEWRKDAAGRREREDRSPT